MSISEASVAATVAGVQFTLKVSESVPSATYLKIVHLPTPPAPVPSPQFASFKMDGTWVTYLKASPVVEGVGIVGADAYPVSGTQKSPVCVTVPDVGNVTTRPDT